MIHDLQQVFKLPTVLNGELPQGIHIKQIMINLHFVRYAKCEAVDLSPFPHEEETVFEAKLLKTKFAFVPRDGAVKPLLASVEYATD